MRKKDGIIVGTNQAQEWLLPWWWLNYRLHNKQPVTFVDFGISEDAKKWCQERGDYVLLEMSEDFIAQKEEIYPLTALVWEAFYRGNNFWPGRLGWFKKPFALLQSPYERTIWIDLDCQVRADLSPLFATCENPAGIAMVRDRDPEAVNRDLDFGLIHSNEVVYNGGLIVFAKDSPVITEYARMCHEQNKDFMTDQLILSRILYLGKRSFTELPRRYNTWTWENIPSDTAIFHWVNKGGKAVIQKSLSSLDPLFFNSPLSKFAVLEKI